jgi:hypothetical protein
MRSASSYGVAGVPPTLHPVLPLYHWVAPGPATDQALPLTLAPMQYVVDDSWLGGATFGDSPPSIDFRLFRAMFEYVPLSA